MNEVELVDEMQIEHACTRLIQRFALLNDAGDFESLAAMFTEDGVFARPSAPNDPIHGRHNILRAFQARSRRLSRHLTSNIVIDVLSATEAQAISYIILYASAAKEEGPVASPPHLIGTFRDRIRLVNGRWLFSERLGQVYLKIAG